MLWDVWRPCHAAVFFLHRTLDGNASLPQVHGWAPLQVLHGDADADTDILFPVSGVGSYGTAGGYFLSSPASVPRTRGEFLSYLYR